MDQIKRLIAGLSIGQRWTVVVVLVLAGAGLYGLAHWQTESGFRPVYNTLAPEDAAIVVQKLKESSTPYRLSSNGSTIAVPEDKVAELRLEMAAAGVPKNGRIGFEIFDKTNFGMTDFAEHINYRRALEGELERSVMSISQVEQARVHITFPQESVFTDNKQAAKASVLVKIRAGDSLAESAVPAITNLISSAVEGLAPESVSILDMRGNLLNRAKRISGGDDLSQTSLEYRQKIEQELTTKLNSTLEPLVGAGRFRTAVSAECDMTSGEQSDEIFDPTHSVMVASQTTEDTSSSNHLGEGIPGTASNLPETASRPETAPRADAAQGTTPPVATPPPTVPGSPTAPAVTTPATPRVPAPAPTMRQGTSRKTENINYQTSRTVKKTVLPQGAIKKLSVSVLIDQEAHWEGTGVNAKRILVPPTAERLKVIHDLVAAAAGLNTERGDQLIVESLPFESTLNIDLAPAAPAGANRLSPNKTWGEQLKSNSKLAAGLASVAVVVLSAIVFLINRAIKKKPSTGALVTGAAAAVSTSDSVKQTAPDTWSPSTSASAPALSPGRVEMLTNRIRETARTDPEASMSVLRGWLREERS